MLGGAIQGGFRLMDIVPTDQFKGVEKYGGLMLERGTAQNEVEVQAAGGTPYMQVTVDVNVPLFEAAADAVDAKLIVDLSDANQLKKLAQTVEEDLETWLGNNGGQWLEEGIDQGVYDDFITK
jgi:hypothetical protein